MRPGRTATAYNSSSTVRTLRPMSRLPELAERVDRLLLRQKELSLTNDVLAAQLKALTQERDALKSRLAQARLRIDALLQSLPGDAPSAPGDHL